MTGTGPLIRPMTPSDRSALANFPSRVSAGSANFRFHGSLTMLTDQTLDLLLDLADGQREAITAVDDRGIAGVARFARDDLETAICWNVAVPAVIRANLAAREIDCDDVLTALQVPLLVTQGRADSVVLPAMAEHVLATCPTAKASWYDGTGHVPHLEDPGRFNRELAELTRHAHS